jgi:23S rRNA (pseudouridine1915-N3)-methyltransferase
MKIHLITIGQPKLAYAQAGWEEYLGRLKHFHQVTVTHIADKNNNAVAILQAAGKSYKVALVIDGPQLDSPHLAKFLEKQASNGQELCFIIGGPDGLPGEVIQASNYQLSLSKLTFPHDLAMVVLAETLYRASTICTGHPYHRA